MAMSDATWSAASSGEQTIHTITVGGETFVRPDWDAYAMGYSACKDDVLHIIEEARIDVEDKYLNEDLTKAVCALPMTGTFNNPGWRWTKDEAP
jgi:hypothetical protein